MVARGWEGGVGEEFFNRCRVLVWEDEFLEMGYDNAVKLCEYT